MMMMMMSVCVSVVRVRGWGIGILEIDSYPVTLDEGILQRILCFISGLMLAKQYYMYFVMKLNNCSGSTTVPFNHGNFLVS